jgi:hypothetical protein
MVEFKPFEMLFFACARKRRETNFYKLINLKMICIQFIFMITRMRFWQ